MENKTQEQEDVRVEQKSSLQQVTPLSKYLAMVLFIILPFLGGYIGYSFAPEKVVEVEKEVIKEVEVERLEETSIATELADSGFLTYEDSEIDIAFNYPDGWQMIDTELDSLIDTNSVAYESPNIQSHIVNAGMGGLPTEGLKVGARLIISSEPANIAESISSSQAYVDFVTGVASDSTNTNQMRTILVAGIPAAFAVYRDVEQVYGGWVATEFLHNERIISITLRYGVDETFSDYQDMYTTVLDSVQVSSKDPASGEPVISVTSYKLDRPGYIEIEYENMPLNVGGLALCVASGPCTEWVDSTFSPATSEGRYIMETTKGVGAGEYTIMVIGDSFTDQLFVSEPFAID